MGHPALSRDLLTYLGNKRSLLHLVARGVALCPAADAAPAPRLFVDAFTGSGVVARWARLEGWRVAAVDMEEYTRPFGTAFLTVAPGDVDAIFAPAARRLALPATNNAYGAVLEALDALERPRSPGAGYFAEHYAPRSTDRPDPDRERLFYTRENALKIDAILEAIQDRELFDDRARDIVLASLLVQMSVHINTSGVMKGYHRGWGGRGGDALSRIMAPISLCPLPLIDGPYGTITIGDAATALSGIVVDRDNDAITYADPPYTIHQYGSNYHLLTSAVRNDRYDPGPVRKGSRAGIRRDHRRSRFASRRNAEAATREFIDAVPTRYLLYSYNDGGILDPKSLLGLLGANGLRRVQIISTRHTKFRGGKATQASRATEEFLFVVDRHRHQTEEELAVVRERLAAIVERRTLHDRYIDPGRFAAAHPGTAARRDGSGYRLTFAGHDVARLHRNLSIDWIEESGERALEYVHASAVAKRELFDIFLERNELDLAFKALRTFKVRKYHDEFRRAARTLAPRLDSDRRVELAALYERIIGEPAPFTDEPDRR